MVNNPEQEMSLIGHLEELRVRLIVSLLALVLAMVPGFFLAPLMLRMITSPIRSVDREPGRSEEVVIRIGADGVLRSNRPDIGRTHRGGFTMIWEKDEAGGLAETAIHIGQNPRQKFYYHSPIDPFVMHLKMALLVGILLALPVILWQIYAFVAPGLTASEKQVVKPMLAGALILFPMGAVFAFFMVKLLLLVMQHYGVEGIDPMLDFFKYLSLLTTMMIVFGVIFEMPLLLAVAARVGIVTPDMLTGYRRHAYVILAIAAAVFTPADIFTMFLALVPLVVLYEASVLLVRPMARRRAVEYAERGHDPAG